ncbi:hypothetical protein [Azospirillum palustre]
MANGFIEHKNGNQMEYYLECVISSSDSDECSEYSLKEIAFFIDSFLKGKNYLYSINVRDIKSGKYIFEKIGHPINEQ